MSKTLKIIINEAELKGQDDIRFEVTNTHMKITYITCCVCILKISFCFMSYDITNM